MLLYEDYRHLPLTTVAGASRDCLSNVSFTVGVDEVLREPFLKYLRSDKAEKGIQFLQVVLYWSPCQKDTMSEIKLEKNISPVIFYPNIP